MSNRRVVARIIAFALEDHETSGSPLVVEAEAHYNEAEDVAYVDVTMFDGEQLQIVVDAP